MESSRELDLADGLNALTEALDGGGDDLNTILAVLVADITVAISSFVGVMITVAVDGEPVTVMAMNSHEAATSMLLPLTPRTGIPDGSYLVLYAQNPGAFVDLAADARATPGMGSLVLLDQHLPPPTTLAAQQALQDLTQRSTIDQAIGFLIEQGHPPGQARTELHRRANAAAVGISTIAQHIIGADPEPNPRDEQERAG